jgi:hypothetical protein
VDGRSKAGRNLAGKEWEIEEAQGIAGRLVTAAESAIVAAWVIPAGQASRVVEELKEGDSEIVGAPLTASSEAGVPRETSASVGVLAGATLVAVPDPAALPAEGVEAAGSMINVVRVRRSCS